MLTFKSLSGCSVSKLISRQKIAIILARTIILKMFTCILPLEYFLWHFSFRFTLWHFLTFTNKMDPPIGKFMSIYFEHNSDIDLSSHWVSIQLTNIHYKKLSFRCSVSRWINTHMFTFITTEVAGIREYFIYLHHISYSWVQYHKADANDGPMGVSNIL